MWCSGLYCFLIYARGLFLSYILSYSIGDVIAAESKSSMEVCATNGVDGSICGTFGDGVGWFGSEGHYVAILADGIAACFWYVFPNELIAILYLENRWFDLCCLSVWMPSREDVVDVVL